MDRTVLSNSDLQSSQILNAEHDRPILVSYSVEHAEEKAFFRAGTRGGHRLGVPGSQRYLSITYDLIHMFYDQIPRPGSVEELREDIVTYNQVDGAVHEYKLFGVIPIGRTYTCTSI